MLILTKDNGKYCEVAAVIDGQQKKSFGFIYGGNVFIKAREYGIDEYEKAIKEFREEFLDNEEMMEIPTLMLKESNSVSIWLKDSRYKPLNSSQKSSKTISSSDNAATLKLRDLIARMRGQDGLAIKTRRHKLKLYHRCFLGNEAVDWLSDNLKLSRSKAIKIGQKLIDKKVIHHVSDEHNFKDEPLFYRFYVDDDKS